MEEAARSGRQPITKRRSRWQAAAAAAAATLGVVALARGGRTAPTGAAAGRSQCSTTSGSADTDTTDLVPPPRARNPWRWATSASGRLWLEQAHMDETAAALWWGYNMMERFRDYSVDPAFPSFAPGADWLFYGATSMASARTSLR